ncbi:MAG: serine hydrolase domain-containing protein, partial [Bacteroidota bacterium]
LGACQAQMSEKSSILKNRLDSLFKVEHQAKRFDGTVVIGTKDAVIYSQAWGLANRVWDIPLEPEHRFDICSLNKSFVAALMLKAEEEGKLSLNDPLVDHLKDYTYTGHFDSNITLHQMLSHTSGLPDYEQVAPELYKDWGRAFKRKHFSSASYVDFISQLSVKGKPEGQFYYSNFAYHLLMIILEDVYQMPFAELLKVKITRPLSMDRTFSPISNETVFKQVAEGYNYEKKTDSWKRNQFIDMSSGRRIFSTAFDLYLWAKALDSPGILSEKSRDLMFRNHTKAINPDISYGYGWAVHDGQKSYRMGNLGIDRKYIIHGGSTEGFKSMLINIEQGQYIISFLANTGDQTNEIRLAQQIVAILIDAEG